MDSSFPGDQSKMPNSPSVDADEMPLASTGSSAGSNTLSTNSSEESFTTQILEGPTPQFNTHLAHPPNQTDAHAALLAQMAHAFQAAPMYVPMYSSPGPALGGTVGSYGCSSHTHESALQKMGSFNYDRGSIPLVERDPASGAGFSDSGPYPSPWRQNAARVAHPDDRHSYSDSHFEQNYRSKGGNRYQSMQNSFSQRDSSNSITNDPFQGQHRQSSLMSDAASLNVLHNAHQNFQPEASSQGLFTPRSKPLASSAGHLQTAVAQHSICDSNQMKLSSKPKFDIEPPHSGEKQVIKTTLGQVLKDYKSRNIYNMDDITPRHPVAKDETMASNTPGKLNKLNNVLRSRNGQSMVGLDGSPIQRSIQTHCTGTDVGVPPTPNNSPAFIRADMIPSERADDHNRASSASAFTEGLNTALGAVLNANQQVTPAKRHTQLPHITTTAEQRNLFTMPPHGNTAFSIVPYQPAPSVSRHLSIIALGGKKPSLDVAFDVQNFPFVELSRRARAANGNGVVRISNIPYSTSCAEIVAFVGRNAELVEDKLVPIHIIMDRISGKTQDAYVELLSMESAVRVVNRQIETHRDGRKGGRLGNRFVSVQVCGLEQMMRALFPKAMNVTWHNAMPTIQTIDPNNRYNSGFKGFINSEELTMLVKHVQDPNRIHFSEKCPQRPFESMISIIAKYPWYVPNHITIRERDEIFAASLAIVRGLLTRMDENDLYLNSRLFKRLTRVIFDCPGFTEAQKDDICFVCNMNPYALNPPLAPMADHWYVFKTIGPKPGVEDDVLKYYIALIREATTSMSIVTLAQRGDMFGPGQPPYFGNINIQYPLDVKNWTLAQVAPLEWNVIDTLLRRSLATE